MWLCAARLFFLHEWTRIFSRISLSYVLKFLSVNIYIREISVKIREISVKNSRQFVWKKHHLPATKSKERELTQCRTFLGVNRSPLKM